MTLDNLAAASLESGDLVAGERFNSQAQTLVREKVWEDAIPRDFQ